jgi:hypothetical protein
MADKRPYWFPTLTDAAYCSRLREDYPYKAHMTDEELIDYYADGNKYATTWDHIGDAYEEYEPLCDLFLELLEELKKLARHCRGLDGWSYPWILEEVEATIAKAEGAKE